jgi:hypothetical protein
MAGNWTSQWLTSGINPSNGEMPRGPVMGSHVAPSHQLKWHVSKKLFLGSMGFEPMTTTKPNTLRNGLLPIHQIIAYDIKPTI